ncbi:ABC transporter ATP-binding protein [Solirubrobacter soli]|uniref:ABC transporter ATP-binding protein n=1 Tax=Solirubrobacter soli TaxID=363832 RepID=UPI00040A4FD5|nr:ABC transporter ATP-binding protein [Solirubrobacter soli]
MTALLEARDVKVRIGDVDILHGADLSVSAGELVAVVGPNGAGKSTLSRAVSGLQRLHGGDVRWSGTPLAELKGRRIAKLRAFVPQRAPVPAGVTVREAVELGRSPHIKPLGRPTRHDRDAVDRALERTAVAEFADRKLTTLSGGELQRVQIAVGLAQEAPVLIADEPTSHLDLGATASVARLLRDLADGGLSVILVVHDLALAAAVADTVVVMAKGRSAATGAPRDVLTPARLSEIWGVDATLDERGALHVNWLQR